MPLYPCFALLIAFVVERSAIAARATTTRRGWNLYLSLIAGLISVSGILLWLVSAGFVAVSTEAAQPSGFATLFALLSFAVASLLWWAQRQESAGSARLAVAAIAIYLGVAYAGPVINAREQRGNDLRNVVARLKAELQPRERLASFGPIDHRFAFYYRDFITEHKWPRQADDVPVNTRVFCYKHHRGDTAAIRRNGRGMYCGTTPGSLPFEWEEIARIPCDRNVRDDPETVVVVGRVIESANRVAADPLAGGSAGKKEF